MTRDAPRCRGKAVPEAPEPVSGGIPGARGLRGDPTTGGRGHGRTCADAVRCVPQRAEVAVRAVGAQSPPVPGVALARPVALSAAVPAAVAVPAAGPLGPALARCGDTSRAQSAPGGAAVRENVTQSPCSQLKQLCGAPANVQTPLYPTTTDALGTQEPASPARASGQPHAEHSTRTPARGTGGTVATRPQAAPLPGITSEEAHDRLGHNAPRQSGPYIPGEQQTSSVFTQNHSNKSGCSFFLRIQNASAKAHGPRAPGRSDLGGNSPAAHGPSSSRPRSEPGSR